MTFTITFKTPDVLDQIGLVEPGRDATEEEQDEYYTQKEKIDKVCSKFMKWNEYVSIEFDSEAMTATVV